MGTRKAAMTRIVVRIVTTTVTEAICCPPGCPPVISEGKREQAIEVVKYDIPRAGVDPDVLLQDIIQDLGH